MDTPTTVSRALPCTVLAAVVVFVTLAGCGPAVEYRPTLKSYEAREEGCEFRVFRGHVAEPYLVLGRV